MSPSGVLLYSQSHDFSSCTSGGEFQLVTIFKKCIQFPFSKSNSTRVLKKFQLRGVIFSSMRFRFIFSFYKLALWLFPAPPTIQLERALDWIIAALNRYTAQSVSLHCCYCIGCCLRLLLLDRTRCRCRVQ